MWSAISTSHDFRPCRSMMSNSHFFMILIFVVFTLLNTLLNILFPVFMRVSGTWLSKLSNLFLPLSIFFTKHPFFTHFYPFSHARSSFYLTQLTQHLM